MNITSIKTKPVVKGDKLEDILNTYIPKLGEQSVVAITSKIVSICQGRIVPLRQTKKDKLIEQESQYYLPRTSSKYNVSFTIARNFLVAGAGIDESNGNGYFVLWPSNPQKSANFIRGFLTKKFKIKNLGIIITDSRTHPLRWGVTGFAIAHSGFSLLKNYIGQPDLFGRKFQFEKLNIGDSLAAAAVAVMGEGNERTPIAVIEDVPFVQFQDRNPTKKELSELTINPEDDLYAPLLTNVGWIKGKKYSTIKRG